MNDHEFRPYSRPFHYRRTRGALWLMQTFTGRARLNAAHFERKALKLADAEEFRDGSFREPFELLLNSLQDRAELNAVGRSMAWHVLLRCLVNRLAFEKSSALPQVDVPFRPARPPLFVVGMPRTGTTLLHKLLAADPVARPLLYWESVSPVMAPTGKPDATSLAARQKYAVEWNQTGERLAPWVRGIHKVNSLEAEECQWLLMNAFRTWAFPLYWNVPEYEEWLDDLEEPDWVAVYQYYMSHLRLLDRGMQEGHWVLKCPLHAPRLGTLAKLQPRAIFIQTYRDISEVVGSCCSLNAAMRRVSTDDWTPTSIGTRNLRLLANFATDASEDLQSCGSQMIHIHYNSLIRNPVETIRHIYLYAGMTLSLKAEDAMSRWIQANPQGRHGQHRYSLADFGLNSERVYTACAPYHALERTLADEQKDSL